MSSLYPGVVEYAKENPITYKRIKQQFKAKVYNRKTFYYLKGMLKKQNKNVK
jgi:hypothetical protein